MDASKYPPSNQLARAFDILRVLFANAGAGSTPTEIARATGLSGSYVTQQLGMLANLRAAEEVGETGRWRPGIYWIQRATAFSVSCKRAQDDINELVQRSTRQPT